MMYQIINLWRLIKQMHLNVPGRKYITRISIDSNNWIKVDKTNQGFSNKQQRQKKLSMDRTKMISHKIRYMYLLGNASKWIWYLWMFLVWTSLVPFSMLLNKITFILCVYIITLSLQQFNSSSYLCIVCYWQVSEVKHCMSISTLDLYQFNWVFLAFALAVDFLMKAFKKCAKCCEF
jgi:hypothetical protein